MRKFVVLFGFLCAASILPACATMDTVNFVPREGQRIVTRDGMAAVMSSQARSMLVASPATREMAPTARPVLVLALGNLSGEPIDLRVANITVERTENGQAVEPLRVMTYESLVREEKRNQVIAALLVGAAGAANSMSAANAGYGTARTTVYGPGGTYTANTTIYSPLAAQLAADRAAAENSAMFANFAAVGQASLANLEGTVIKDSTVFPGEWYGGALHIVPSKIRPPKGGLRTYRITVRAGGDVHQVDVAQIPAR